MSQVGDNHRATLRREAVITVVVGRYSVSEHSEFLREPHALMAAWAGGAGEVLVGDGRVRIGRRVDGVNAVAIRADRRETVAASGSDPYAILTLVLRYSC